MEFVESISRNHSSRLARLTVTLVSERSNWVSVSNPLANQLFDLNVLPVVLQLRVMNGAGFPSKHAQHTHHVAWTGGVLHMPGGSGAGGGSGGTLGVPSALAAALCLHAGTQVHVAPLLGVPPALSVEVEPAGESDWEVVEANAGFLEEQLLCQVGVVSRGQLLTVWARGGASVALKVLATQPADLVRLVPGCEVHVAPKPRALVPFGAQGEQQQRQQHQQQPSRAHGQLRPGGDLERRQQGGVSQLSGEGATTSTVVPLGGLTSAGAVRNGRSSAVRVGDVSARGGGSAGGQPAPGYQSPPLQDSCQKSASFKGALPVRGNGAAINGDVARMLAPPYTGVVIGGGGGGGGSSPLVGGFGLKAPPAWASGVVRQASGRFSVEQGSEQRTGSGDDGPRWLPANSHSHSGSSGRTNQSTSVELGAAVGSVVTPLSARAAVEALGEAPLAASLPGSGRPDGGATRCASRSASEPTAPVWHGPAADRQPQATTTASTTAIAFSEPRSSVRHDLSATETSTSATTAAAVPSPSPSPCPAPPLPPPQSEPASHYPLHATTQQSPEAPVRRYQRHACRPRSLRLRVLDLPPVKYMVPLTQLPQIAPDPLELQPRPSPSVGLTSAGSGGSGGSGGGRGNGAASILGGEGVSSWLTLAVAMAPLTAAALVGAATQSDGDSDDVGGVVVRLHGRGTVQDLLGVLVLEPACPRGHVMLAPPLQHVLCVLPHMHVTVTPLPAALTSSAAVADVAALPGLTLHPLPLPMPRNAVVAAGGGGGGRGVAGDAPAFPDGTLHHHAVLAAVGSHDSSPAASAAGAAVALLTLSPDIASHAVLRWLTAQANGLRRVILTYRQGLQGGDGATANCFNSTGKDENGLELLLPIASGTVIHFHVHGKGNSSSAEQRRVLSIGGAGCSGLPQSTGFDDYCLIVHAVRPTQTASTANTTVRSLEQVAPPPPLVSERTLAELVALASKATEQQTQIPPQSPMTAVAVSHGSAHPTRPPLAAKLGQSVVLSHVSYDAARNSAVLVQRPLPPPLQFAVTQQPAAAVASCTADHVDEEGSVAAQLCADLPADIPKAGSGNAALFSALDLDLDHISWLQDQLDQCLRRLLPQLDPWVSAAVLHAGLPRCGGVLVTGAPGSGRSQVLAALGDLSERHPVYQVHVVHVQCSQLTGSSHSATTLALAAVAAEALHCSPSLILLDDLDCICPSVADGPEYGMQHPDGAATAARLADWLSALLDELAAAPEAGTALNTAAAMAVVPPQTIAVVASARAAASLHPSLRQVGRLDFEVRLPTPGSAGRAAMLAAAARQRGLAVDAEQLAVVAKAAEGFEGGDLRLLLDRAVHVALRRQLIQDTTLAPPPLGLPYSAATLPSGPFALPGSRLVGLTVGRPRVAVTPEDLEEALRGFVPAAFWGVQRASASVGKAHGWEDVGGMTEVIAALREALLLPVRYRDLVASAPLRLRTGALLYGPPGCGKTHVVAAAVAAVSKIAPLRFLQVKGPELLNKYIGASEAAVRDLFARASAAAPSVLFFDEFDALAPPRGHDSTGVTDRVVNQLLTELDGVEGLRGVVVLAATSRPDLIDAALLRPGRLDRLLYCGPPHTTEQRLEILQALSRWLHLAPDVDLGVVAASSSGMTGADLGAVLSEAQLHAVNESVEAASTPTRHTTATTANAPAARMGRAASAAGYGVSASGSSYPSEEISCGSTGSGCVYAGGAVNSAAGGDAVAVAAAPSGSRANAGRLGDQEGGGGNNGGGSSGSRVCAPAAAATPGSRAGMESSGPEICMRHVQRALAAARPSLPAAEAARLAALYDNFRRDREGPGARESKGSGASSGVKRVTLA